MRGKNSVDAALGAAPSDFTLMIPAESHQRISLAVAVAAILLQCASLPAQTQPSNPSFSSTSDVNLLDTNQTQFGTFRQGNPGAILNFNVYNRPAATGTTSPMTLVHNPPSSIGDSTVITLQTGTVNGLQPVGVGGTPNAPMQLAVLTSLTGSFSVSYQLEFSSDSLPATLHESIAIAAFATVLRHGDYNADGKVDAGDYTVWRKTNGQSVAPYTRADDNGDGLVGPADYSAWRAAFTGTFGSGSSISEGAALSGPSGVPEPTTAILGLLSAVLAALVARPRQSR